MTLSETATQSLSQTEVELFWESGFHIIRNALTPDETNHFRQIILDLVPRDLSFPSSWTCSMGRMKPYNLRGDTRDQTIDTPELIPLLGNEKCYAVAAQLLRCQELRVFDASIGITLRNDAPSPTPRSQKLHIDASVPDDADFAFTIEETQLGGCYYLNDVEENCGGIHIVPGGHLRVEREVKEVANGRQRYSYWKDIPYDSVEVTAKAGDFILLHHLVPHAASHNRHGVPRVAQFTRYVRVDQTHGYGAKPPRTYNDNQLAAMTPLCKRLLGIAPW
jgi:hypothetical protein